MGKNYILAIDQGTTSTRTIIFDQKLQPLATAQKEFAQHFPHSGWVEHDPEDLWSTTAAMCRQAIEREHIDAADIAAIGITNQRETTVVWNRHTGRAIYNAIVWQDRRTADYCRKLREAGHESEVTNKTGLLLDPYFSATKLNWILENVDGARAAADAGDLLFGTVDSYLIWRLTDGASHVTDATNAARTMMYNISEGCWDDDLLALFAIPKGMLPEVRDSSGTFGVTRPDLFGGNSGEGLCQQKLNPREHKTEEGSHTNAGLDGWYEDGGEKAREGITINKGGFIQFLGNALHEAFENPDSQRNIEQAMRECNGKMCVEQPDR